MTIVVEKVLSNFCAIFESHNANYKITFQISFHYIEQTLWSLYSNQLH